jgi:hypothetical protein
MTSFGRKPRPEGVFLNVYDLHPHNSLLGVVGLGVFHSGLEVHGTEYSFGGGGGIFSHAPGQAQGAKFKCRIQLGEVAATSREVERVVEGMRESGAWSGDAYRLMGRNCNTFADALSHTLCGTHIPPWVNRVGDIGAQVNSACSCIMPRSVSDAAAPVEGGAPSASSSGAPRFGGSGMRLGAGPGGVGASAPASTTTRPGTGSTPSLTEARKLAADAAARRAGGGVGGGGAYAALGSSTYDGNKDSERLL